MCDILVIDDDAQMRAMLTLSLEERELVVEQAASAAELFERLEELSRCQELPRLAVCDYRMPGGDGLMVVEKIKREFPTIQVILVTAFGDENVHRRARALGAAAVFDKPFALSRLHDKIDEILGRLAGH